MGQRRVEKPKRSGAEIKAMVGGGRNLLDIAVKLVAAILGEAGGTTDDVHHLSTPPGRTTIKQMAELAVRRAAAPVVQIAWSLVLPWIIAAGRFENINSNITAERFPLQPNDLKIKKVHIVKLRRVSSAVDARKLLDEQGLRPATLLELLWWWLTNPDRQADCLVVALGQVWEGVVPYVHGAGASRELDLCRVADGWTEIYAFAAVEKDVANKEVALAA